MRIAPFVWLILLAEAFSLAHLLGMRLKLLSGFFILGSMCLAEAARPNVVFILTDDQRSDALSCMGHPHLKTPRIDQLAAEGVLFKNHFCTTSLCSPSRASILGGLYAHSHGVVNNSTRSFGPTMASEKWFPATTPRWSQIWQLIGWKSRRVERSPSC